MTVPLLFVNGQVARGGDGGLVGGGDHVAQARQCFGNLRQALEAGGALADVAQCRVSLVDCAPETVPAVLAVGAEVLAAAWKPETVSVCGVQGLGYPRFRVEVEATATPRERGGEMTAGIERVHPAGLAKRAGGAAQVLIARRKRLVFVNAQMALEADGRVVGDHAVAQSAQVFRNVARALAAVGASGRDVVHYRIAVVNYDESMHEGIFGAGQSVFGAEWFDAPCIVFGVTALERPECLVCAEVIAAIDEVSHGG